MRNWFFLTCFLFLLLMPTLSASAQVNTICVVAYEDSNQNTVRDAGETSLPGISVHLAVNTDIIVQTHITTADNTPFCFENVPVGNYTVIFADSPNHRATTLNQNPDPFEITAAEQRIRVEFGAVPAEPLRTSEEAALADDNADEQLEVGTRLLLAGIGAIVVMIFMLGFGAVLVSVIY